MIRLWNEFRSLCWGSSLTLRFNTIRIPSCSILRSCTLPCLLIWSMPAHSHSALKSIWIFPISDSVSDSISISMGQPAAHAAKAFAFIVVSALGLDSNGSCSDPKIQSIAGLTRTRLTNTRPEWAQCNGMCSWHTERGRGVQRRVCSRWEKLRGFL